MTHTWPGVLYSIQVCGLIDGMCSPKSLIVCEYIATACGPPTHVYMYQCNVLESTMISFESFNFFLSIGILSKSAGQTLRIAACYNILFRLRNSDEDPLPVGNKEWDIIPDAVKAASNFVDVCCIHAAYMAGRTSEAMVADESQQSAESFFLLFPGNLIKLTDIINAKRFRSLGKKDNAVEALQNLHRDGLGTLKEVPASKHSSHQVSMKSNKMNST